MAELLRRYHVAVASFDASGHEWPRAVPSAFRGGLLCHNDPNLDNDGHESFRRLWDDGGRERADRMAHWLAAQGRPMRRALRLPA